MKNLNQLASHAVSGMVGALSIVLVAAILLQQGLVVISSSSNESLSSMGSNISVVALDVADIVEKIDPAVVSIVITKDVPIIEQYYEDPFSDFFGGGFFSPFSFQIPKYRQNGTEEREIGGGTGFFVSDDGYIVTNAHVVEDQEAAYTVFTNDEIRYDAEVVAMDDILDVAVLKVNGADFPYLTFGDSNELRLGQAVIAIGNALGEFRNTVSTGVVSGVSRTITASTGYGTSEALENVIQTDAAINPGNSGGPLLNLNGEVIGVNVAVASNSENIGFSLPANVVKSSVESIIRDGKIVRPYLGVRYVMINETLQQKNHLSVDYGALILRGENQDELAVMPGSPADKAGLKEYDIILEIDGKKIGDDYSLANAIHSHSVGDSIKLKILDNDEEREVTVSLEETPS